MLPGTLQSSNTNSQVLDPRIPSLSSLGLVVKPSIPYKCVNMERGSQSSQLDRVFSKKKKFFFAFANECH